MTKQQRRRKQEQKAVAMFVRGVPMKKITKATTVPGWWVRGLVVAYTLRHTSPR